MVGEFKLLEGGYYMSVAGHLQTKKNNHYAVMNITEDGKRKPKWIPTGIKAVRGNKKPAENILNKLKVLDEPIIAWFFGKGKPNKKTTLEILDYIETLDKSVIAAVCNDNIPVVASLGNDGSIDITKTVYEHQNHTPEELNTLIASLGQESDIERIARLKKLSFEDFKPEQIRKMLFCDFMAMYLPVTLKRKKKKPIELTTYSGYCNSVEGSIYPYFKETGVTLEELTADDINVFYDHRLETVKATTVIANHAIIRLALCFARKQGYIKENPIEEVDKPEKEQFIGKYYSVEEYNKILQAVKGTHMEIPVIFGGYYGLRRSEIVGLRWSVFDFESNIFHVNHTITMPRVDGKVKIIAKDKAKTKSSLRAMPLSPAVKARLLQIKEEQEAYHKKFKRSYSKEWQAYLCVDELGGLISPDHITSAFPRLIEKNNFRRIRFHDLRHTSASLLLNKGKKDGITMKDIQIWLGHSDYQTTANTYAHLDIGSKETSMSVISNVINI